MNRPVDVIATFNTKGEIKPNYIRLEDKEHLLHTYQIQNIEYSKDEKYTGICSILFLCYIIIEDIRMQIKLRYIIETHKWMYIE